MRPVYMIGGGLTPFRKSHAELDFRALVKTAFDAAREDLPKLALEMIDGSVASYFSDFFARQTMAGIMAHDYLGLCPLPSRRIEGGGATGGLCFQSAWEAVSSGRMELCLAFGFETMSHVNTWKGNEFIALASDTNFDYPVGGFYTGYYAMMVQRHMYEFGTTPEQMALVSIKNHANAQFNPYAQSPKKLTVEAVRNSKMVATPLTMLDICTMSDGAAVALLASEAMAERLCSRPVKITGVGTGTDTMRLSDRPRGAVPLLAHEEMSDYETLAYPGVHSCRGGRIAAKTAYEMAGIQNPAEDLDFVELHDAYTSSEIQAYEDLGLCKYGEGGVFAASGAPFLPGINYGLDLSKTGKMVVNPSGGLLACGHPIGATGLMQAVFAFWQLQGRIAEKLDSDALQVKNAKRGLIHSHAGTGTYITVSVMEQV